jgi:predicted Zn-dependent peptidase
MRFYAYESHDLPYVYFTLLIKAGDVLDPADKIGLAEVTANTLRSGGSTTRSGDDIDRDLEQIGSELSISADREYVRVGMFALADKKREALAILADLLQNPGFDEKKLEQQKDRELEDIRRENDEPSEISRREFRKLIYGASYPLARTPKPQNITSISRDDVRTFYETYYRPSMISIGVSGDISVADGKNLITEFFGNWKKPAVNVPPIPEPASTDQTTGGIFLIKRDTAQSQIRMGHFGVPRQSAEQYALNVMNVIYGSGGFSSRLMNEVRTRRGYVYGVGGAVTSDDPLGLFFAAASSRPKTTVAAIEAMLEVTQNLLTSKISDGELELAKKDTIYSFISNFDLPREIVWQYMYYDFLGYPASYLPGFVGNVQAVTSEQVIAAAKKYIHPDQLKIFVIGNTDAFDKPLTSIGPVQEMKLESTGGEPVKPAGK